ncbi:MAG: energy transducer TonB [Dysgonamonadaceae bacterium]|jgi:protein TonB|nr:energy transducer TonB [Dysgonamonadaceae bacterium]
MTRKIKIQKRLFLFLIAILTSIATSFAQDVITLKDGKEITALVYEISDIDVKYKKIDNPNGPNYVLKKADVLTIKYANGSKDEFPDTVPITAQKVNQPQVPTETPPEFPGGEVALQQWLKENLKYPEDAKKNEVQGKVVVNFTVERSGNISFITVAKKIYPALDKEAVRLVKAMPKWKPATKKGKAVAATHNITILFKLD